MVLGRWSRGQVALRLRTTVEIEKAGALSVDSVIMIRLEYRFHHLHGCESILGSTFSRLNRLWCRLFVPAVQIVAQDLMTVELSVPSFLIWSEKWHREEKVILVYLFSCLKFVKLKIFINLIYLLELPILQCAQDDLLGQGKVEMALVFWWLLVSALRLENIINNMFWLKHFYLLVTD